MFKIYFGLPVNHLFEEGIMRNKVLLSLMLVVLAGCAADLKSGRKFEGFQTPPDNKSLVYFVRNENFMAAKLPYIYVNVAIPDSKGKPAGSTSLLAVVGKDMFVPVLMDPGTYLFSSGSKEVVSLQPKEVKCIEVGGKFRGITVFVVEPITMAECEKVLPGKDEGVQVIETLRRTGQLKAAEAK